MAVLYNYLHQVIIKTEFNLKKGLMKYTNFQNSESWWR